MDDNLRFVTISIAEAIESHKHALKAVSEAEERLERVRSDLNKLRSELIKKLGVGRNVPMKSVQVPDSSASIVVRWVKGDPENGVADRIEVYWSDPSGGFQVY